MTLLQYNLGTKFGDVQFGVQRSYRYHVARQKHYEFQSKLCSFISIFLIGCSGFAIVQESKSYWLIAPVVLLLIFTFDLISKPTTKAAIHKTLADRFNRLDMKMVTSEKTEDLAEMFQAQRQEIELDEPPSATVLSALTHNELLQAVGSEERPYDIGWFRRIFAQWGAHPPKKWVKVGEH